MRKKTQTLKTVYNVGTKRTVKKVPMNTVFESQLDPTAFTRTVTFIVIEEDNRETVVSWKKKNLEGILEKYDYVDTERGRLPRFIRK